MRLKKKRGSGVLEGDLTPMIDMTFQLIAFFMVLINFSQSDAHDRVVLPDSSLAKPPKEAVEYAITMQLDKDGVIWDGEEAIPVETVKLILNRRITDMRSQNIDVADGTIIVRAHQECPVGSVQELIKECQAMGFEIFALRAKEKVNFSGATEFQKVQPHLEVD